MKRTIIIIILSLISVACYLTGFFLLVSKERVIFSLHGEEKLVIDLNEKYEEPGYVFQVCKRKKCGNYNSEVLLLIALILLKLVNILLVTK